MSEKDITEGRRTIEEMKLRLLESGKHLVVEETYNGGCQGADRVFMFEVVVSLVQDNNIYVRKLYSNDVFVLDLKKKHRIVNELGQ